MLRGVGDPIDVHEVDDAKMREAIRRLRGYGPAWPVEAPAAVEESSGEVSFDGGLFVAE